LKQLFTKKNPAPYPPGPPGFPIIGNVSDMPGVKSWLTFTEWGKNFGSISHVEVLGQHMIVLNSMKTAMEMLDKKSSMYSDRPVLPMGGELVGWKHALVLLPYGDRFREYRKNIHRVIGSRAALHLYHPFLGIETHRFLKCVLAKPDQLQSHVKHTAGAIMLRISHGDWPVNGTRPLKRWYLRPTSSSRIRWLQALPPGRLPQIYWRAVLCLRKRITS